MITESFGLFSDANLTSEFSGTYSLEHFTDLSDNPQDFVLYLGSGAVGRELVTSVNPGVDSITLSIVDLLPEWEAATAYIVGDHVQPTTSNGYKYVCTVAGTTHASVEPTWPVPPSAYGTTVVNGTATFALLSPKHATTEIKLALTSGGLASATGGASLALGNTIESEVANLVEVHIRIENAVTRVSNNIGTPDLGIQINSVVEVEA